jgi:hypothetical protein
VDEGTLTTGTDAEIDDSDCLSPDDYAEVAALSSSTRKPKITPHDLSRKWCIGLETAKKTIQVTTQSGIRNIFAPSERKVRFKAPWLKFPSINTKIFADQMFAKVPGIHGETGATAYTDGEGFDHIIPWKAKQDHPASLLTYIQHAGVPKTLVTDGANEMQKGRGREIANEYHISLKVTVPYSPWQNKAEAAIRENKRFVRRKLKQANAPPRTWAYCAKWGAGLRRLTALSIPELNGRTATERVTGCTPDISAYAMFDWYQPVYYHEPVAQFPYQKRAIGRIIGVADNCTDELAYYILPKSCIPIVRKSVWAVPPEMLKTDAVQADILELDSSIRNKLGPREVLSSGDGDDEEGKRTTIYDYFPEAPPELFEGDEDDPIDFVDPDQELKEADEYTPEEMDEYLSAELLMPHGDSMQHARVMRRVKDDDGIPLGKRHPNPILDSRLYELEFPDGSTETVATNIIAENLYSQIDAEGKSYAILDEIVGHRKTEEAVPKEHGYFTTSTGQKRPVMTTKGWEFEVKWKDGSSSWLGLKDLKVSNSIELAEYAVANKLDKEPAFNWWARKHLRKRDRIISKVKSRYWKRTHKFGIELPKSVREALKLDELNGNSFWRAAIEKEMKNVGLAFEFPENGKVPPGFKKIDCHMIFDIKSDLTRKARFVAGGHMTDPPKESVFSSVVTRDSVRIAFTIAALNDLHVLGTCRMHTSMLLRRRSVTSLLALSLASQEKDSLC